MLIQNSIICTCVGQFSLFLVGTLPTSYMFFASSINIVLHPNYVIEHNKAIKLTNLGIFFVKSIIDPTTHNLAPKTQT